MRFALTEQQTKPILRPGNGRGRGRIGETMNSLQWPLVLESQPCLAPGDVLDREYHALVQLPSTSERALLVSALAAQTRLTICEIGAELPVTEQFDIAVLHPDGLNLASSSLLYDATLGLPEIVFVVDDPPSPQYLALKSRGFRNVVRRDDLCTWLPAAVARLGLLARARRIVMRACTDEALAPVLPPQSLASGGIKLHAAESRFRAAFLRSLLAEHGSRRRASEAAGVPYRSFCEMLRKLGI